MVSESSAIYRKIYCNQTIAARLSYLDRSNAQRRKAFPMGCTNLDVITLTDRGLERPVVNQDADRTENNVKIALQ